MPKLLMTSLKFSLEIPIATVGALTYLTGQLISIDHPLHIVEQINTLMILVSHF